ncbi:hypothetical protein DRJ54_03675 [Candidatus Acetothermia bacterium]|nr:MAG: hypothetical protein DRJ54_03675 [Candidatus Acetothermia bacterium]
MKCVICKQGVTRPGKTTVTLQRDGTTLVVVVNVPAEVCENCGEAYVDEATAGELLRRAEEVTRAGVLLDIREYVGANKSE